MDTAGLFSGARNVKKGRIKKMSIEQQQLDSLERVEAVLISLNSIMNKQVLLMERLLTFYEDCEINEEEGAEDDDIDDFTVGEYGRNN